MTSQPCVCGHGIEAHLHTTLCTVCTCNWYQAKHPAATRCKACDTEYPEGTVDGRCDNCGRKTEAA